MLCPISGAARRFNVYVQSQIGSELEAMWGTATWLMIFLMGGAFGNLASMVFLPTSIGVGASGGIMGLLGVRVVVVFVLCCLCCVVAFLGVFSGGAGCVYTVH